MLTRDLIRVRVRGRRVEPSWIDPAKPALVEHATRLCDAVRDAVGAGETRAELDARLEPLLLDRRDHRLLKGLVKLLLDKAEFAVESPVAPAEIRQRVFSAAAARGPLALEAGPLGRPTAADVLAQVAAELELEPEAVSRALYADRKEEQVLLPSEVMGPDVLLERYNVALVQAVLLRATEVRIRLVEPSPARIRQLLRWAKFHQLMHRARREGKVLHLVLDGPVSLLKQSTRYGLKLASFFPAVLLQPKAWSLEADVSWGKAGHRKTLEVDHEQGLSSHYPDTGAYRTRTVEWFEQRFSALDCGWQLRPGRKPLGLGGRAVVMPDFDFVKDGRTAHLEIVGFWRKGYLERRLDALAEHGPRNLILAVSRKLLADDGLDLPGQIVPFKEVVPPRDVLAAVERLAT